MADFVDGRARLGRIAALDILINSAGVGLVGGIRDGLRPVPARGQSRKCSPWSLRR